MVLRREPVDLGEVVRDVVTELLPLARARNQQHRDARSSRSSCSTPITTSSTRSRSTSCRTRSATRRSRARSRSRVDEAPRERYPGGWARLRVRDNGVGIAEEDRQRIFDPFLHPQPVKHHTSAGPDSAGLGLYIARGLIELHGGLITVDSQPEVFTEFTVLLPFKQPTQPMRAQSEPR